MNNGKTEQARRPGADVAVTREQIEALNLNRILILCVAGLAFELLNVLNPVFWSLPRLWFGAAYITLLSLTFFVLILWNRKFRKIHRYRLLNTSYWLLLIAGYFPFLENDAMVGDKPLNCALLATVLICGPILEIRDLNLVFAAPMLANFAAPLAAARPLSVYYLEAEVITTGTYLMARNLHGRYFRLLDEQTRQYEALLKAQLEQEKLQRRLEEEQDANAAKTRFLSLMSHDLRTPLSGVIGLSERAMQEQLPAPELQRCLMEINHSGHYLLDILNDVLDMSRIESCKITLHPEPCSLSDLCAEMRNEVEPLCAQKDLTLCITLPAEDFPPYILVDRTRFQQIFLNLLTNSVKYTQPGGRIELLAECLKKNGARRTVRFTVRDNGIGISKEFLRHAFEPFSQEQEDDSHTGTGLGLTIVKNLTELMGGTVRIDSEPGHGTSVILEMELDTLNRAPEESPQELARAAQTLAGKRFLICEDNEINAEIIRTVLQSVGASSDHALNGRRGLELFSASAPGTYQGILMDIRMPEMDGIAAARAIRALDRPDAAAVPIIALTANAFPEDRQRCLAAGMNDHIAKPIDTPRFLKTLEKYLRTENAPENG